MEEFSKSVRYLDIHQLMSKGMQETARFIYEECKSAPRRSDGKPILRMLPAILEYILSLQETVTSKESVEWLRHFVAGNLSPAEFSTELQKYDFSSTCGLVWTANFFAYRCRTCSLSPCMSICASCFQKGDHTNHDFNMFKSQAGGACDCGNSAVMKESGFCKNHSIENVRNAVNTVVPESLSRTALVVLPKVVRRIILACRRPRISLADNDPIEVFCECDDLLNYLHDFIKLGSGARSILRDALCNPDHYSDLSPRQTDLCYIEMQACQSFYKDVHRTMPCVDIPPDFGVVESMQEPMNPKTYLDELIFWTIKYEFPEKLVYFLLNMKPDAIYEEALANSFVRFYSRMCQALAKSPNTDVLGNSIVHITVQLFSDESLAYKMVDERSLLHIVILCISSMLNDITTPSTIHACPEINRHQVVSCTSSIMRSHRYWPIGSDLNNILSHRPITELFLSQKHLIGTWCKCLSLFQGMNPNVRELLVHVEFEPHSYYAAFSGESQLSATPLWAVAAHLRTPDTRHYTQMALQACFNELEKWIYDIGFSSLPTLDDQYIVSFHLPLHRNYALYLCQLVKYQGQTLEDVVPSSLMFQKICHHPLAALAAAAEISNDLWVRNGVHIKGQLMTYMECQFCNYTVDLDLFLLQLGASQILHNDLLNMILKRFDVYDLLTYEDRSPKVMMLDQDKINAMIYSFLKFLAQLVTTRTYLDNDDDAMRKLEMSTVLCGNDRTHSQVFEFMPERCRQMQTTAKDAELLKSIADYRPPVPDFQGTYTPKDIVWEHIYDPMHSMLRQTLKKDCQSSIDRFRSYYCERENIPRNDCRAWPPYRLSRPFSSCFKDPCRVLADRSLHAVLFSLLFKSTQEQAVPEDTLSLVIYLLELVIEFEADRCKQGKTHVSEANQSLEKSSNEPQEDAFNTWYSSDDIFINVTKVIHSVRLRKSNTSTEPTPSTTYPSPNASFVDSDMDVPMGAIENTRSGDDFVVTGLEVETYQPSASALAPRSPYTQNYDTQLALTDTNEHAYEVSIPDVHPNQRAIPQYYSTEIARCPPAEEQQLSVSMESATDMFPAGGSDIAYDNFLGYSPAREPLCIEYDSHPRRWFEESIITLLLKLYDKLRRKNDPNFLINPDFSEPAEDSRIGDAEFFIRKILNKLGRYSNPVQMEIRKQIDLLFPKVNAPIAGANSSDERRKAARARQEKIAKAYATKQKVFLENIGKNNPAPKPEKMEADSEYMCVICRKSRSASDEASLGIIAAASTTSILGYMRTSEEAVPLPLSSSQEEALSKSGLTQAAAVTQNLKTMKEYFDHDEGVLSMNNGYENGVHVQTCGHYIHLKCHQAYEASLKDNRMFRLAYYGKGYRCPLCRMVSNALIPLAPEMMDPIGYSEDTLPDDGRIVADHLERLTVPVLNDLITSSMDSVMETLTCASNRYSRRFQPSSNCASVFSFISSVIRTNVETELVSRGGNLLHNRNSFDKRGKSTCLSSLFYTLSYTAKVFVGAGPPGTRGKDIMNWVTEMWNPNLSPLDGVKKVPMLLKDPLTVLIQLFLLLPTKIRDRSHYHVLVRFYQLTIFRACLSVWYFVNTNTRDKLSKEGPLAPYFALLEENLGSPSISDETSPEPMEDPVEFATNEVREKVLVFLRPAALLISSIYHKGLPYIDGDECSALEKFLGVYETVSIAFPRNIRNPTQHQSFDESVTCLDQAVEASALCKQWCQQLIDATFIQNAPAALNLLKLHRFFTPKLLSLPTEYTSIFRHYHERKCRACGKSPEDPAVCLVCGTIVCLRGKCCIADNGIYEGVTHAMKCGSGTALYLAIIRCNVIVVRDSGVCIWGTLYLDNNGEADIDLRRGDPLLLCKDRFEILEQAWLNHSFEQSMKIWSYSRDSL